MVGRRIANAAGVRSGRCETAGKLAISGCMALTLSPVAPDWRDEHV